MIKRTFGLTSRKSFLAFGLLLVASVWGGATWTGSHTFRQTANEPTAAATKARLNEMYGQLPLSFEANVGQADPQIDFISRGSGYALLLTPREAVLSLRATQNDHESASSAVLRMKFVGSEANPRVVAHEELPGKVNYLIGKDSKRW